MRTRGLKYINGRRLYKRLSSHSYADAWIEIATWYRIAPAPLVALLAERVD